MKTNPFNCLQLYSIVMCFMPVDVGYEPTETALLGPSSHLSKDDLLDAQTSI